VLYGAAPFDKLANPPILRETELRPLSPLSDPAENPIAAKEPVALETIADEDLGTRVVAGPTAFGRRKVFAVPAGVVGKSPAYEIEREQWRTSGRDIPVRTVVRNGGNHTTTTVTITPLDRDVRSSMFEIPEGYARH